MFLKMKPYHQLHLGFLYPVGQPLVWVHVGAYCPYSHHVISTSSRCPWLFCFWHVKAGRSLLAMPHLASGSQPQLCALPSYPLLTFRQVAALYTEVPAFQCSFLIWLSRIWTAFLAPLSSVSISTVGVEKAHRTHWEDKLASPSPIPGRQNWNTLIGNQVHQKLPNKTMDFPGELTTQITISWNEDGIFHLVLPAVKAKCICLQRFSKYSTSCLMLFFKMLLYLETPIGSKRQNIEESPL